MRTVLVIDDNPAVGTSLDLLFGLREIRTLHANSPDEGLAALAKARDLAPNSEDVLSAYAQLSLAVKRPMPAVLALEALTRMCPSVAQYHYLLGVGLMAIGDMPAAVAALSEADRLEPERAVTLLALGLALNNRKEYADARSVLRRSAFSITASKRSAEIMRARASLERTHIDW